MKMTTLFAIDTFAPQFTIIRYVVEYQDRWSFWVHTEEIPNISTEIEKKDICDGVHIAGYYWSLDQLYGVEIRCACQEMRELEDRIKELSNYVDLLEGERDED